jgi:hypothetical protein
MRQALAAALKGGPLRISKALQAEFRMRGGQFSA